MPIPLTDPFFGTTGRAGEGENMPIPLTDPFLTPFLPIPLTDPFFDPFFNTID